MKYIDTSHTYLNDSGESYVSVTRLIKDFEPHKNWDEIAANYAKKHKKTVEEVQASWKEEGRKAIEKGTAFHEMMERKYVEQGEWEIDGKNYKVQASPLIDGIKIAIPLKLESGIYPEVIVYSHKYKIAGQVDLVEVADGKINVKDYKTSKEIKKESFKHWKNGHEMMMFPLNHLMNCNFNQYALQINIYMFLLKTHNPKLKLGEMSIYHIKDSIDVFSDSSFSIDKYEVPNLQKEAKKLLEQHLKTLDAGKNIRYF